MRCKKLVKRADGGYTGGPDEPYQWMTGKGLLAPLSKPISKRPPNSAFISKNGMGRSFTTSVKTTAPMEYIPPMFGGNKLSLSDDTQASIATDNSMKWGTVNPIGSGAGTTAGKSGVFTRLFNRGTLDKVGKFANEVTPFISNITNAFRKPPMPKAPVMEGFTNLSRIDLSGERYDVKRTIDAANKSTERNLPSNEAEAIKAFNRGEEFNRINVINERENNTNVGITNQQAMMDAQVKSRNVERSNDYSDAVTARGIAHQREQSANIANAGDKLVLIDNEKRKAKVETAKAQVLSSVFSKSGVLTRNNSVRAEWKKAGIPDPLGKNYEDLEDTKKFGGMLKTIPTRKLRK